jgi:zinc and cadmium transporter
LTNGLCLEMIRQVMEAVVYSLIAGGASVIGILLVMRWHEWTIRHSHLVNSLAAGVILGVAFFAIMPEAVEMAGEHALGFVLVGFVVFYVIETVAVLHSGAEMHFHGNDDHAHASRGWTIFLGLFIHSLVDGIVIGMGFEVEHGVGILAAASVILHELPEGATTFVLLLDRLQRRTALILSVAVGLATPVGTLMTLAFLPKMGHGALGLLLAAAAGTFIYVGASDLVPETHTRKGWINAIFLIAGASAAFVMVQLVH